jgi:hypothetical protein
MKGDMAAIKLVLKLDREAELADRAAAPEFPRMADNAASVEWTEGQEKLLQDLDQFLESEQGQENDPNQT